VAEGESQMSVDAVVYKTRDALNLGLDSPLARIEPETGEVYFEDEEIFLKYPDGYFEAASFSIGNITLVGLLRDEISALMGEDCLICEQILYDGTHTGDCIPLDEIPALADEVERLCEMSASKSSRLVEFSAKLKLLIAAAEENRNPIVF
jgi:hypothetical protein